MTPEELKAKPELATTETVGGGVVPYAASFDHDPTDADLAPYRPPGYES